MRVLIISCNRERSPQAVLPAGACRVAAATKAEGHEIHLLDLCFERLPARATFDAVRRLQPAVVGLSIRNLDNCDFFQPRSYLPEIRSIVDACRTAGVGDIVIGGPAVSLAPAPLLRYLDCRYAIMGEGEKSFPALLRALDAGHDPTGIPGVIAYNGQDVREGPARTLIEIEDLPAPDYGEWLALAQYRKYDAAYPVQTKRGCAFHCSYCVYPVIEGHHWRLCTPDAVVDQVKRAEHSGLRSVEFVDSVFGLPKAHAIACCDAIARAKPALPLSAMELNPTACTAELTQAMNAAGFTAVAITAESGSDVMLAQMQKGFSVEQLHRASQALHGFRGQRMWIIMLGAPGETEATVRETARFIARLPAEDLVFATNGVRVLPDTALHQQLLAEGEIDPTDELIWPRFYHSPQVSAQQAQVLLTESGFPSLRLVTLHDGAHRWLPTIQQIAARIGLRPPYWRHIPLMNIIRRVLRV